MTNPYPNRYLVGVPTEGPSIVLRPHAHPLSPRLRPSFSLLPRSPPAAGVCRVATTAPTRYDAAIASGAVSPSITGASAWAGFAARAETAASRSLSTRSR